VTQRRAARGASRARWRRWPQRHRSGTPSQVGPPPSHATQVAPA
jgi:hypothetical protein